MQNLKAITKWVSISLLSILVIGFATAFMFEIAARNSAESQFSPEGELVDVGGHKLHFVKKGIGAPTVIFESGLDSYGHLSWFKVQNEIAKTATTITYDRAGILWSEPSGEPKTGSSISNDLSELLRQADLPKPYIIVAHSSAGISSRKFISDNLGSIAGLVLVDVSHPEQVEMFPPKVPPRFFMKLMYATGLIRRASAGRLYPNTTENDRINQIGPALLHKALNGQYDEAAALVHMGKEAEGISDFGDLPITVISAAEFYDSISELDSEERNIAIARQDLQTDLLGLSTNSKQILARDSAHYVQLEEPEIVINAIRELIR